MTQGFGLMQDSFRFTQLVFVNSAAYAYTQIQIDQHTALFGANNLGKTSMLNALKLFLLPEVNFQNNQKKFNFRGSSGKSYTGLASYRYYFPEDKAFIILEAENHHGLFCIVLHRGTNTGKYEYARIAVPLPYAKIRRLFWDTDDSKPVGRPIKSMTLKDTITALREMGGVPLNDRKVIQERLFTYKPYDPQEGRFSLLPLRNGAGIREQEAWRKLIHLAFDISAQEKRTLPDTLATIIEGQKSREQERFNLDLTAILEEANELRKLGDWINLVGNAEPDWQAFQEVYFKESSLRQQTAQEYVDLDASLTKEEERISVALEEATKAYNEASHEDQELDKVVKELTKRRDTLGGANASRKQQLRELQARIDHAGTVLHRYGDWSRTEVIKVLEEDIDDWKTKITGYDDAKVLQENLQKLHETIQSQEGEVTRLAKALESHTPTVLESLSVSNASILHSLTPELGQTHGMLSPEQKQAFTQYAQQFHAEMDQLILGSGDNAIHLPTLLLRPFDAEATRQQQADRLSTMQKALTAKKKKRDELRQESTKSTAELTKLKKQAENQLAEATRQLNDVNALASNETEKESLEEKLAEQEVAHGKLANQLNEKSQRLVDVQKRRQQAYECLNAIKRDAGQIGGWRSRLNGIAKSADSVFEGARLKYRPSPRPITGDDIEHLDESVRELHGLQTIMRDYLRRLLGQGLLPDQHSKAMAISFSADEVRDYHDALSALYQNLDSERVRYRNAIETHQKTTSAQVDILRSAREQVSAFMGTLNRDVGGFRISNLDAVEITYSLHPRFTQLLDDLDRLDPFSGEVWNDKILDQLKAFQADFFRDEVGRGGVRLSLDKLLDTVSYRYRKVGETEWTSDDQSNGTTMMINSNLLSILMARLMEAGTEVTMPLVMDEFASLDPSNMRTARDMAERHGFYLFVASPHRDRRIIQVLGNYVHLGSFHATEAYSSKRTVVHHGPSESLTEVSTLYKTHRNSAGSEPDSQGEAVTVAVAGDEASSPGKEVPSDAEDRQQ
ncbi:hypothetical protein HBJ58_18585 [Halomonas desiderata]|uniref:hypothetical protein n=1 Tax=Billgrantia desiderata TaxID=52021 RepID=UPI00174BF5D9|nr:hypothetical protein [Halomonas desiderata]